MTDKFTLITSVLGFNFNTELKDAEDKILPNGIKSTCYSYSDESPSIGTKLANRKWFTHYNQSLLDKIRDLRRLND
jgi:hypothetical protein